MDNYADAFYSFNLDDNGGAINVALLTDGLYFDNSKYATIPPFNPSHNYTDLPFTGTGNTLLARMVLGSYANNQNVYLYVTVCEKT